MSKQYTDTCSELTAKVDAAIINAAKHIIEQRFKRGATLTSPETVIEYLSLKLSQNEREVFAVVFLDTQHRVIAYEELFFGTINGASVYPREIVKRALALNASALIISHNHPSGIAEPSQTDIGVTEKISQALRLVDIKLLDHIVVGSPREYVSFSEKGLL